MGEGKPPWNFLSLGDSKVEEMNIHQVVISMNVT